MAIQGRAAPRIYDPFESSAALVFGAACAALAGEQVDWGAFSPADWNLFAHIGAPDGEGVGPLLAHGFRRAGWPAAMPAGVREAFERMLFGSAARNTLLLAERDRVLDRLAGAGIEAIALKGAALVETVYEDPALRPMGDLDFLLREADIEAARGLLLADGYADEKPDLRDGLTRATGFEVTLVNERLPGGPVSVELHWRLLQGLETAEAGWPWTARAVLRKERGRGIPVLAPEAALLYGAAHLAYKHPGRRSRLIWYYDLAALMRRYAETLDWDEIRDRAQRLGWSAGAGRALREAEARFGLPQGTVPGGGAWAGAAEAAAYERFLERSYTWAGAAVNTLAGTTLGERVRKALALIFPSRAYMRWRYGVESRWALPYWYLRRWVEFLIKSGRY